MRLRTTSTAACAVLLAVIALAGCNRGSDGAAASKEFKPGPTDHDSTIVKAPSGLGDQLSAPLVTRDSVDDPKLWANQLEKKKQP
jgi:ribose transport system substrate-binding protein